MWLYFSSCLAAKSLYGDQIGGLAGTVLSRTDRALQARDAIAYQFYSAADTLDRDELLYHFDYLCLLISGALDAQARVAHIVYGISQFDPRYATFRNPAFVTELARGQATSLCETVNSPEFQAFSFLLSTVRNTIHAEGTSIHSMQHSPDSHEQLLEVQGADAQRVRRTANTCGSTDQWGVSTDGELLIEPFTFSVKLMDEALSWIDRIAESTEVLRLFASGVTPPQLLTEPPDDLLFNKDTRQALDHLW